MDADLQDDPYEIPALISKLNEGFDLVSGWKKNLDIKLEQDTSVLNISYKNIDKGKIIPDVFAAYCTESTFSFLTAAVASKWIILKDLQVKHLKGVDGASSSQPHGSLVYGNSWNNLLYGRDARDFIFNQDAIQSGLGYEECNKIINNLLILRQNRPY